MKKIRIYRADQYTDNMGDLIGFFLSKQEAESNIEFTVQSEVGDGTFSQITEFEVESERLNGIDIKDNNTMLDIWGDGEIGSEFYYVD